AEYGFAGLNEFEAHYLAPRVAALRDRVTMQLDAEVDQAYPQRWIGKVTVSTRDGHTLSARVDEPKGDPGNTLTRAELEDKAQRLAAYGKGATPAEVEALIARVWAVAEAPHIERWLAA
ncbi:MAG: MmgE/PrpD family protein, partial [Hydrogenophaga sp.]|nr:MmgE/PrpD family protein [Hydrogenophaga sp.]